MIAEPEETRSIAPGVEVGISSVARPDGSEIAVYSLATPRGRGPHPTIVLLHGSGADSVFPETDGGYSAPLLFGPLCERRDRWRVFFVEKRGVFLGQRATPGGAKDAAPEYVENETYQGRVADACQVLDEIGSDLDDAGPPLVLIGSSEGSAIAVGAAANHGAPTHIALLPFSAGHGLHDSLASLREDLAQGRITSADFLEQYDWLVSTFQDIHGASADSVDEFLWGHAYRRWSSHCSGRVMEDLLSLEIPVFLGIPSLDQCEGVDLAVAEAVRHGKTNLTYHHYINHDHGFFEHDGDSIVCRHSEVLADMLRWVGYGD